MGLLLNLEPDPGPPRTRDPRLAAALLSLAAGTLLLSRWIEASVTGGLTRQHAGGGAGLDLRSPRLLIGCALLAAGAAAIATGGREGAQRLAVAAAACGGVLSFAALQATGRLAGVRREFVVVMFVGTMALAWKLLAPRAAAAGGDTEGRAQDALAQGAAQGTDSSGGTQCKKDD